jgi:hypothetical protein
MKPVLIEAHIPMAGEQPQSRRLQRVTINLAESPLGWLYARGLITSAQFNAGEQLRRDFVRAGLSPRVTMNWDAPPIGAKRAANDVGSMALGQMSAKRRFLAAMAATGTGLADILWRVICAGETVPEAEKALGWPGRAGRVVLSLALDRVAGFYCVPRACSGVQVGSELG